MSIDMNLSTTKDFRLYMFISQHTAVVPEIAAGLSISMNYYTKRHFFSSAWNILRKFELKFSLST